MIKRIVLSVAVLLVLSSVSESLAGDRKSEAKRAKSAKCKALLDTISQHKAVEFEKKNSDEDLARGFISYSRKAPKESRCPYIANIFVRWGDLDNKVSGTKREFYENWDGYVHVPGERIYLLREFAFDDGSARAGSGSKSSRRSRRSGEPREGSGRDKLLSDYAVALLKWKSGVVGATDGLLFRMDLKKPCAKGVLVIGKFKIPFEIAPKK